MSTRITFQFEHCFSFDDEFSSYEVNDPDLVTRATDDFVRFARHVKAMTVEHLPYRAQPSHVPITRFVAISPGLKLETSYLPTLSDATVYIREALKPFVADDASSYTDGDVPPGGHYGIRIEDEGQLAVWELRDELRHAGERTAPAGTAPRGEPAIPTIGSSQKTAGRKKAKKKAKKKTSKKKA